MDNAKKVIGTISAGSTPVYEVIKDDEKKHIIIGVIGNPEESISIPINAMHILMKILSRITSKTGLKDDDIILAIDLVKNAQYGDDFRNDTEGQDSLMRILMFLRMLQAAS